MAGMAMDLSGYLARIGLDGRPRPDLGTLHAIVAAHNRSIPFENLDPLLGIPVADLSAEALSAKLVDRRRGGYCYEHNGLLGYVLEELGFDVERLSGRVVWMRADDAPLPAQTHNVLSVAVPGADGRYLVDVGFGGQTLTSPIRLEAGPVQQTRHEPYRLTRRGDHHTLAAQIRGEWQPLYTFTTEPRPRIDLEVGSWYVSTHPGSHFVTGLTVAVVTETRGTTCGGATWRSTGPVRPSASGSTARHRCSTPSSTGSASTSAIWPAVTSRHVSPRCSTPEPGDHSKKSHVLTPARRPYSVNVSVEPNGRDRLRELLDAVVDSENDGVGDMARNSYASEFHFSREVRRLTGEPPAALRRRIMLERAAWRLRQGAGVAEVAAAEGWSSPEVFSRAFRRAFGVPPSRATDVGFRLPAPNGVHFHPPRSLWCDGRAGGGGPDIAQFMLVHDIADTAYLIEQAYALTENQWRQEVSPGQTVLDWDGPEPSVARSSRRSCGPRRCGWRPSRAATSRRGTPRATPRPGNWRCTTTRSGTVGPR